MSFSPLLADASSNLLAARNQMAFTLGFHIILASFGVAFPAMMLIAEYRGRRHGDAEALALARFWSKGVAVLFAVGAVTGTVLSFEFGLLWPGMMDRFGDAFGIAFAIEGIFFFLEAIFIGIYIYGWDRVSGWAHFWSGIPIFISGIGGAFSVISANAWMNTPQGFKLDDAGNVTDVEPLKVIFNPSTMHEFLHMWLAAYVVVGFLVASVYAVGMLKGRRDRRHRIGFAIPFTVAAIAIPIQLFVGDTAARDVAADQPVKFAAMECIYKSGTHQAEQIGGICTDDEVKYDISIPGLDSLLVDFSTGTYVQGLDKTPDSVEPQNLTLIHLSFDGMVGIGSALALLAAWYAFLWWRKREIPTGTWFLRCAAVAGVAAVLALEMGWIVTEVGRQPWIVSGYMKVKDAVTPAKGIWFIYGFTLALYIGLGVAAVAILRALSRRRAADEIGGIPYGPPEEASTK